jgi:hypothetical protein
MAAPAGRSAIGTLRQPQPVEEACARTTAPADLETVWAWHEDACSDLNQAPPAVVGLLVAVPVVVSAAGSWLPGPG